jgi:hypothetical protein
VLWQYQQQTANAKEQGVTQVKTCCGGRNAQRGDIDARWMEEKSVFSLSLA